MKLTVGTFNLNNLFSRYNFQAEIDAIPDAGTLPIAGAFAYAFGPGDPVKVRSYMGKLVKAKDDAGTQAITERIQRIDVDVLAVQEVEDIDTLRQFNRERLGGMYPQVLLIEGNDPRLIDVGVLSRYPIGGFTSWQRATHPDAPDDLVFGRDVIEVEILNASRSERLFTLFNTHLKSNYVDFREDEATAHDAANERRRRQAETVARIIKARTRPDSRYALVGDMNDAPTSEFLRGFTQDTELKLVNGLMAPQETRPAKPDNSMPASSAWTHRFKPANQPAQYELYDQVWLSPALAAKQTAAWVDRRTKHSGDGSDHDPAWVELNL
ncbi:MAG TPA: endonuclease/exonuclease/phosphatase family protein [Burkholderiales bacterium]